MLKELRSEYADRLRDAKGDRRAWLSAAVCVLLLILIVYSLYVRVKMYTLGLSLWNDEALLVEFIVNRSFGEMLLLPQTTPRTEPFFFLMTVKSLSLLFGTSEAILRIYSFASLILMLVFQGLLLRRVFHVSMVFTLFSVAVSSTLFYYMQHSAELKPYMGDAAFVLIVLFGYYSYRKGSFGQGLRGALLLALLFSVCMLFSSPSAFAAGAVFIVEFFLRCYRKDKPAILVTVIGGAVFLAAFALNYLLWLRPIATSEAMLGYWDGYQFNIFLYGREALQYNISLIRDLLEPVWGSIWIVLPCAVIGFIVSLARRNIYTLTVGVFFILLLAASALEKYPMISRLWLFLYVIMIIYAFVFIDAIRISIKEGKAAKAVQTFVPLILAVALLAPNMSFPAYGRGEEWTLAAGNQANPIIAYLEENIREGEMLYAYFTTDTINTVLRYKIGYDNFRIGNVSSDNVIFGEEEFDDDIELIVNTGGSYIFFYHSYYPLSNDWYKDYMVKRLQERGYLEQILNVYHTYLYWFTDDPAKIRTKAAFNMTDLSTDSGILSGSALIENTGRAILAPEKPGDFMTEHGERDPDRYGRLYVVLTRADAPPSSAFVDGGIILGEFMTPVLPGETADIVFRQDGLEPGEYRIELVSYGQYLFSELGTDPVYITITG